MKNGRYEEGGTVRWYFNDQLHREDGPAIELPDGSKEWFVNGERHRSDGPAIKKANGSKSWYLNGQVHREDESAIEYANGGYKAWYINDELHRDNGPACIYQDPDEGDFSYEWYLHDIQYTEQEFQQWLDKKNLNEKLHATLEPKPTQKRLKI